MTAGGGLSAALAGGAASTVEEVIARLVEIDGVLPAAGGGITRGAFVAPHFVAALDVAFANLYFTALRAFAGG